MALTTVSRDVRHQDKVVSVTGRVLTAGASRRLFGQLQEVGWTKRRGRQTIFCKSLHVWERLCSQTWRERGRERRVKL